MSYNKILEKSAFSEAFGPSIKNACYSFTMMKNLLNFHGQGRADRNFIYLGKTCPVKRSSIKILLEWKK